MGKKQPTCVLTGKINLDKGKAKNVANRRRAQGERVIAYWCGCGKWHVGHTTRRPLPSKVRKKRYERYKNAG